ncbi:MAG: TonB-dependent receptor domain-containing protein [Verrucomicrobiia bacterium]
MKVYKIVFICVLAIANWYCAELFSQNPASNPPTGEEATLIAIEGKVEVMPTSSKAWEPAKLNMKLKPGDRLRTGVRSRATIQFSNQSTLRVNELTTITIRPPQPPSTAPGLGMQSGSTYFYSRERPGDIQFQTPLASGAIRGTEFHIAVAEDGKTELAMFDGAVEMSNQLGQVELKTGELGIVEPGQPPRKTAVIEAINIIQWALYYPAIIDINELQIPQADVVAISRSIELYRSGDLLGALGAYPENRKPLTDAEKIFHAAILLSVGRVDQAEVDLNSLSAPSPLANALRQMIAAVKFQKWVSPTQPILASEWMAESYYMQSQAKLREALEAAKKAVAKDPQFGFARSRVAELEFSFGRTARAVESLDYALKLTPRNAYAVALKGFLLAAKNRIKEAQSQFEEALSIDSALGYAWFGRGLCRIRLGDAESGRRDLQVAATVEPQRAIYRSYLGKAWSNAGKNDLAEKELSLAMRLDPQDPTAWLYAALLDQQRNMINRGVRDLEKSAELNENRKLFRSKMLLDQDKAVRSANLAAIYQDAGMTEVSIREATRAVDSDYANYSAHLFLANSYEAMIDRRTINLRFETPWLSELLLANLLAPPGAGSLSQYVSQQEYSRMFDKSRRLGLSSSTEYYSGGDWFERASQFGTIDNTSYAIDYSYRYINGQFQNNKLDEHFYSAKVKQQLTDADSVYFQAYGLERKSGDLSQYYDPSTPQISRNQKERQQPGLFLGYNHQWSSGINTLILASRIEDEFIFHDPSVGILSPQKDAADSFLAVNPLRIFPFDVSFNNKIEAYSLELQQIFQTPKHTTIVGGRYQYADAFTLTTYRPGAAQPPFGAFPPFLAPRYPARTETLDYDVRRASAYAYHTYRIFEPLQLHIGVVYDWVSFPINSEVPPLGRGEIHKDQVSPKVGLTYTPFKNTTLRAVYTRSLGGMYFDDSVRLEPVQMAGFNQAFRGLIPDSVAGLVPGTEFDTYGIAIDQRFNTGTYITFIAELLQSDGTRGFGVYELTNTIPLAGPDLFHENLKYEEKALTVAINQLVGEYFSLGGVYRLSDARLHRSINEVPITVQPPIFNEATLHNLRLYTMFNHPCGFFSMFESSMYSQSNRGYSPDLQGDAFWHFNLHLGYRFARRHAEARLSLLNLTDRDYRLNPLNLYTELLRDRTIALSFRFYF